MAEDNYLKNHIGADPSQIVNALEECENLSAITSLLIHPGTWSINVPMLKELVNLEYLEVEEVVFEADFPEELLQLRNLKSIDFLGIESENNDLVFEALLENKNLEFVSWYENEMKVVPKRLETIDNLKTLDLSQNFMKSIDIDFSGFKNLETLYLSGNPLGKLPKGVDLLPKLETLYFEHANLGSIDFREGEFPSLTKLSLAHNQIQSISVEGNFKLNHLDLTNTNQLKFPTAVCDFTALEILYLSSNSIGILPEEISKLSHLRQLHLRTCSLTEVHHAIGDLQNLEWLGLDTNELQSLPPSISKLESLEYLNLNQNRITDFQPEWGDLVNLKTISLSWNKIISIGPSVARMKSLIHLILHANQIFYVDGTICNCASLTNLNLGYNPMDKLPDLRNCKNLEVLEIPGLKLDDPDEAIDMICDMNQLTYITITQFNITKIPPKIANLNKLKRINLNKNTFSHEHKHEIRRWLPNSIVWFG